MKKSKYDFKLDVLKMLSFRLVFMVPTKCYILFSRTLVPAVQYFQPSTITKPSVINTKTKNILMVVG